MCLVNTTVNNALFNAIGKDVGSYSSPILVNATNQVTAGSSYLADFDGIDGDDTIHNLGSNVPMLVIWNGVIIFDRRIPPTPPSPPSPSIRRVTFPAPWADSSYFNLANAFYFETIFLGTGDYLLAQERQWIFYRPLKRALHK